MTNIDDEHDDALEPDELRSAPSKGNQPLLMAGLGLALMLGGYAATNYVPAQPHSETVQRLNELRQMASRRQAEEVDDALPERLNQMQPARQNPPYQLAGRLAIYGGLFLFVMAGVLMYRSSPTPTKEIDDRE
jgi:hypothetical protein